MSKINDENQTDLIEHIKRLEAKIEELTPKKPEPVVPIDQSVKWPIRHTAYLRGSSEANAEFADKYGMEGETRNLFRFALYEIGVEMDVYADGTYKVIKVTGLDSTHEG